MGNLQFSAGRMVIYVCLVVFALLYLMPLYVMITTSLKDIEEIRQGPPSHCPTHRPCMLGSRLGEVHAPEANARDWLPFSLIAYGSSFRQS